MDLENIMLREISQTQKYKYYMIPLVSSTWNIQIHIDRKLNRGYQRLGGGRNVALSFSGHRVYAGDDEKVLGIYSDDGYTTL